MISVSSIICMIISAAISIGVPIALCIYWKKHTGAKVRSAIIGAVTFYLFVSIFEGLCHAYFLMSGNAISVYINSHPWIYALYASFAAGIFEETGRFTAFKLLFRKRNDRAEGVMYGIGHGGIEAILVAGVSMILTAALAIAANSGTDISSVLPAVGMKNVTSEVFIQGIKSNPAPIYLISAVERMTAIVLHISLSVMVFTAVQRKKYYLYPVAILLHAGVDMFAGLYQKQIISNIILLELYVMVFTAVVAFASYRIYKKWPADVSEKPAE